jgi:chemotaxis protein methyltransferase CheR
MLLPPARSAALRAAVARAAPGLDPAAVLRAAADPQTGPPLMERLIDEITVHESSFLRDPDQLDVIDWRRLRERAAGKIRVWSAGCAGGEEAYTLAILATEAFAPVDVLGTDISRNALAGAAAGRYGERAVRGLGPALRRHYLDKWPDGTSVVGDELRDLVRFQRHNLAHDPIPPRGEAGFDLIVCRNVLIYLAAPVVERVTRMLGRALRPGGLLVLGAADALCRTAAERNPPDAPLALDASAAVDVPPALDVLLAPDVPPAEVAEPEAGTRRSPQQQQRQPPPPRRAPDARPPGLSAERLDRALDAAGRGDREQALAQVTSLVADDPLDAGFHFLHGLLALDAGEPARAKDALRSALCADPAFGLAAFALGRAYDALGDRRAARRAYERALRTLDPSDRKHEALLQQIDVSDIVAACRARLEGQQF